LRDERVQADEEALAEEGEDDEDTGRDADRTDGFCAVGETTDHHGVHDDHAHPADFGEDERKSKAESRAEFGAEDGKEGHGIKEDSRYRIC